MKKILLLATVSLLSLSTFAADTAPVTDTSNGFYLKGYGGVAKLKDVSNNMIRTEGEHKGKVSPMFGVGVGRHLGEKARADVTFDYMSADFNKGSGIKATPMPTWLTDRGGEIHSFRTNIHSVMLNGYVDVYNVSDFNVFVGGGVGYARINEHQAWTIGSVTATSGSATAHNLAYALHTGIDMKVADGVKLELAYTWKNYGNSKALKTNGNYNSKSNEYKGSNATVGMRFDI